MTVGIILHPYGEDKPGGLARTIFEWTKALLEIDKENEYIIFLKKEPKTNLDLPGKNWKLEILGQRFFWKNRLRKAAKADVYIFQTPVLPLFYKPKNSIIITQDYPYKYIKPKSLKERIKNTLIYLYHRYSLRRADLIIAVSRSSKDDTVKFFKVPEEKVKIVYMGYKKICSLPEIKLPLPEKFFLFVGVIKARKNFLNIVKAFEIFKKEKQNDYKLVIGGKSEGVYFESVKKYIKERHLENDVIFLGYLNDGQLSYLYRRAIALVFPSIVESFGFPSLEAMDCGTPVITTKYQGPSEIVRDAGMLIDPCNINEISRAMREMAEDASLRQQLVKKGIERARDFSWQKSAEGLLREIKFLH